MDKMFVNGVVLGCVLMILGGCSPEVGSKAWCEKMDGISKGDWSMNEAKDYTKHCLFKSMDEK